jgi:hypothetical protein
MQKYGFSEPWIYMIFFLDLWKPFWGQTVHQKLKYSIFEKIDFKTIKFMMTDPNKMEHTLFLASTWKITGCSKIPKSFVLNQQRRSRKQRWTEGLLMALKIV